MCDDRVVLPVEGVAAAVPPQASPVKPAWQRWNDYGIGYFLEGGGKRGHFRNAEAAFRRMLTLGEKDAVGHAHLNLARVYIEEGRLDEAAAELDAAGTCDPPAPAWSRAWFTAQVNSGTATRQEHVDAVIADLEKLLDPAAQPRARGFDFTKDYVVWNALANRLFKRRLYEPGGSDARRAYLLRAVKAAETVLSLDTEDVQAHDLLMRCYAELAGDRPTEASPVALTLDEASARATLAADPKQPADKRAEACGALVAGVPTMPAPKLAAIREALGKLRPAFHGESDPAVQTALAAALSVLHRESHAIFKPDEVAQANATRIYREKNPIANYAARARVIYPTAPGHRDAILKTGELPPAR
jgi:tetratricopeptide (TPR) repeat protein